MDQRFSIGNTFKEAWRLTKENIGFLIGYEFIVMLLYFFSQTKKGFIGSIVGVMVWVIMMLAQMGLYNSCLSIVDRFKPGFDELYKHYPLLLSWIAASILLGIAILIGLILFVIPGFYIMAKYCLYPFFIVEKGLGPIEAIKQAGEATKGIMWPMFLLFISCIGLNFLGVLFFGIGILVTFPLTIIALAIIYRKLVIKVVTPEII